MSRAGRRLLPLALLGALTTLTAACGIRATSVPVDAGAAPSRVGCVLPQDPADPERPESLSGGGTDRTVRVYLVCGSRVSPVERQVHMPGGRSAAERLPVARTLLKELQRRPTAPEGTAGFETAVPDGLTVQGPADGDPDEALRLSRPLDELPSYALAQLVCTYADTAAADADDGVVLGGPVDGKRTNGGRPAAQDGRATRTDAEAEDRDAARASAAPLKRFECDTALRTRPQAADTAGTQV